MIHEVDIDEILTEMQALAEDTTGAATVAILACMDVVERHGRIAAETEIAARLQVEPVPHLIVQHLLDSTDPRLKLRSRNEPRVVEYGDPEPERGTRWLDVQGDEWWMNETDRRWETDETASFEWRNLHRSWFPMTEVLT